MIALAVVAILVTVAHASYQEHLRKGRRAAAQSFLVDVANRQQQYLMDARVFAVGATGLATLNMSVPSDVSRFYNVTIEPAANATPPRFSIVATPISSSQQAPDGVLTITDSGARTRNGATGW
jgi:type IV pilus assembly protein PilE